MNLIQQHMENVSLELARLEERMVQLKAEQDETRKLLGNIRRYRKSLNKQYPSSQATLPLALPGDEEEEATDEVDDAEPLVPDERSPGFEVPEEDEADLAEARLAMAETAEVGAIPFDDVKEQLKPIRRRKAKAAAEEVAGG